MLDVKVAVTYGGKVYIARLLQFCMLYCEDESIPQGGFRPKLFAVIEDEDGNVEAINGAYVQVVK